MASILQFYFRSAGVSTKKCAIVTLTVTTKSTRHSILQSLRVSLVPQFLFTYELALEVFGDRQPADLASGLTRRELEENDTVLAYVASRYVGDDLLRFDCSEQTKILVQQFIDNSLGPGGLSQVRSFAIKIVYLSLA